MRIACTVVLVTLVAVLGAGAMSPALAQTPGTAAPAPEAIVGAARDLMQAVRYCAVVSVDAAGQPQARTMDVFPPDENMVVWFATNPKSRKVDQIRKNPRVTVHCYDAHAPELGYVSIQGRARLVTDPAEKQRRWKEGWEVHWPNRDEGYLLVVITPERLEMFSPKHGILADAVTWQPAGTNLGGKK
jgi:general stress protein 26